jgi:CRP/FNR family cyclic AMP-dependent transcriptional regulator
MNVEAALRGVEIFSALDGRQIARLAKRVTCRDFPAGTPILRRGEGGAAMYVILSGRVVVTMPSEEGAGVQRLGELCPGQVFGEIALLDGGPRSADVTAVEPTQCMLLSRWDFEDAMRRDAQIARAMLPVLCARIRSLQERVLRYEARPTTD